MSTLQRRLQQKLEEAQINVSELERRAHLPLSAARRILLGNTKNPTLETIVAISDVLGCSVDELAREEYATDPIRSRYPIAFESDLFIQLTEAVKWYLHHHKIPKTVTFNEFIMCIIEMYEFTLTHPERKIDRHFVIWYLDKIFKSHDKID